MRWRDRWSFPPKMRRVSPFSYTKRHGKNQFGYASRVYSMFIQKLPAYRIFAHQRYRCITTLSSKRKISRIPWIYRISRLQNMMGFHVFFFSTQTGALHIRTTPRIKSQVEAKPVILRVYIYMYVYCWTIYIFTYESYETLISTYNAYMYKPQNWGVLRGSML